MRQVAQVLVCRWDFAFEDPGYLLVSQRPEAQGCAAGVHCRTRCTCQPREWSRRRAAVIAMRDRFSKTPVASLVLLQNIELVGQHLPLVVWIEHANGQTFPIQGRGQCLVTA